MSQATQAIQELIDKDERLQRGTTHRRRALDDAIAAVVRAETLKPYPPAKVWSGGSSNVTVRYER